MDHFFEVPPSLPALSHSEFQTVVERYFEPTKALQELPLILIPNHWVGLAREEILQRPPVQQAIKEWLDQAHLDDLRLGIDRRLIPHTPILIPATAKGHQFFKIAKEIADIPLNAPVVPKNLQQGYWFKTLHYFWQAAGVILAEKMLGVLPSILSEQDLLSQRLPPTSLKNLNLSTNIDLACFRLLDRGQRPIRQWATQHQIAYPFHNPLELWLEIQQHDFVVAWQLGPGNPESEWLTKQQQREAITTRIDLLKETIWQDAAPSDALKHKRTDQYLDYLHQAGWSGYWILALRGQQSKPFNQHLEPYLEAYIEALQQGKALFVDEFEWRSGQPYRKKTTNNPRQLRAHINLLGHLEWLWS